MKIGPIGMRVGISGTHGIGKTTLCRRVALETGLPIIEETVRKTAQWLEVPFADGVPKSMVDIFQVSSLVNQIYQEGLYADGFVSDRTVLDYLVYSYWRGCSREVLGAIEPLVYRHMLEYDLVFYCPIPLQNELVSDGFRMTGENSQEEVEDIMKNVLGSMEDQGALISLGIIELGRDRDTWFDEVIEGLVDNGA